MSKLPSEPKEEKDEGKPVSQLRFRVPIKAHDNDEGDGQNAADQVADKKAPSGPANGMVTGNGGKQLLERRFLASSPLQTVLDYLTTEGYPSSEFKVLSSWPRRDVSTWWYWHF